MLADVSLLKLQRYAGLDAEALEVAGADGFWQPPLWEV